MFVGCIGVVPKMHKAVLDATMRSKLGNLDAQIELCDENGRSVGFFLPAALHERLCYEWAKAAFTDEELQRARRESGGRTTAEVLHRLKKK